MSLGLLGRIEFGFSIQIVEFLYFHPADTFLYVVGPSDPVVLSFWPVSLFSESFTSTE